MVATAYRHLSDGRGDGVVVNRSGEALSFYGGTPAAKPAATAQSAVATTAITTLVTTPTATDIAIAVNSLISRVAANTTLLNQLRGDLVSVSLITGAAS